MAFTKSSSGIPPTVVVSQQSEASGGSPTPLSEPLQLDPTLRMNLVGDTGSGKTSQIGLLAEYISATEGKTTVLFTADKGGIQPLRPYIELGIIKVYPYTSNIDPWIWISHTIRGEAKVGGRWVKVVDGSVGLVANEGLTAFSELLLMALANHSAAHPNSAVGGESAWIFEAQDEKEKLVLASNTMSHYGLVQLRIMQEVWNAEQGAPAIWTSILARSSDTLGVGGTILGSQTVGNKQTSQIARWFDLTMRLDVRPQEGSAARHILFLETHMDKLAKGAKVISNPRLPLAGADKAKVDISIEPADIVKALLQIRRRNVAAKDAIQERMALIRGK